jgi:hypothetical protein
VVEDWVKGYGRRFGRFNPKRVRQLHGGYSSGDTGGTSDCGTFDREGVQHSASAADPEGLLQAGRQQLRV